MGTRGCRRSLGGHGRRALHIRIFLLTWNPLENLQGPRRFGLGIGEAAGSEARGVAQRVSVSRVARQGDVSRIARWGNVGWIARWGNAELVAGGDNVRLLAGGGNVELVVNVMGTTVIREKWHPSGNALTDGIANRMAAASIWQLSATEERYHDRFSFFKRCSAVVRQSVVNGAFRRRQDTLHVLVAPLMVWNKGSHRIVVREYAI